MFSRATPPNGRPVLEQVRMLMCDHVRQALVSLAYQFRRVTHFAIRLHERLFD